MEQKGQEEDFKNWGQAGSRGGCLKNRGGGYKQGLSCQHSQAKCSLLPTE